LIPNDVKWDPNATPAQYTNNEDTVIEPQTHVRVKIIGTRTEVGEMWAIGSIKEDYLGYVCFSQCLDVYLLTVFFFFFFFSDVSKPPSFDAVFRRLENEHDQRFPAKRRA
jgi:hypothetical protein